MVPTVIITYYNLTGGFPSGPISFWLIPLVCYLCTVLTAFMLGRRGIWPGVLTSYAWATLDVSAALVGMLTLTRGSR